MEREGFFSGHFVTKDSRSSVLSLVSGVGISRGGGPCLPRVFPVGLGGPAEAEDASGPISTATYPRTLSGYRAGRT